MKKVFLVLLFVISVFGCAHDEIGVPYATLYVSKSDAMFKSQIINATFSLDGDYMYTYSDELVTIYKTNPMEKVSSFHIKPEKTTSFGAKRQKIFVTNDKKRLIFYSPQYIQLWDIQTKNLLKQIPLHSKNAVYSHEGLIILTDDSFIEILDDIDLKVIRRSTSLYVAVGIPDYDDYPFEILENNNKMLLRCKYNSMFVDLKTLKIIDQTAYNDDNILKYIKKYKQDFSPTLKNILENVDYSGGYSFYSFKSNNGPIQLVARISFNKIIIKKYKSVEKDIFDRYLFSQNGDNWLLYHRESRKFSGSKNLQKYLKMRTKDRSVVPMNEATFKKYYTTINLKD